MTGARRIFDWRGIHAELDRRLTRLGSTYETDAARAQALLRQRAERLAKAPTVRDGMHTQTRMLVFQTAGERYGLALDVAHEIFRLLRVAPLPGAAPSVLGIVNWRGEYVIVFDTARLVGLKPGNGAATPYAIVLRGSDPVAALAVGALEGIVRVDLANLQAPDRLRSAQPELFKGITRDAVPLLEHGRLLARLKEELRAA